jgi:type IV pilus assembly protein PilF
MVTRLSIILVSILLCSCAHFMTSDQDREKAKLHLQIAADQYNNKEYAKSIESVQEALKLDPQLAAAHNHLALIYMEMKRYPKSEDAFRVALKLQPEYPEVFNNFGVLMNRQDHYKEAIPWFEKAIASEKYSTPENAYTNLGYTYYKLGDSTKAKAYHAKALDVAPQFCLASKNMGDVYAKEKNYSKAADYFQRAVTNCPLYEESQYKLALVLMKMGQRKTARTQLEKLVERHKNGPYVDRSNEVLKYLH